MVWPIILDFRNSKLIFDVLYHPFIKFAYVSSPFTGRCDFLTVYDLQAGSVGTLGTPIFDTNKLPLSILPANQPHDLLVRNEPLGDALARTFSTDSQVHQIIFCSWFLGFDSFPQIVLMKGHGMAVRGQSVRDAVFRAFYTMLDAQVQLQSHLLGAPANQAVLTAREATDAANTTESPSLYVPIPHLSYCSFDSVFQTRPSLAALVCASRQCRTLCQ